jgi:hypothetical protein
MVMIIITHMLSLPRAWRRHETAIDVKQLLARPSGQRADRPGRPALTPRLAEILARMVEAALAAEDAVAGGGSMPDRRERVPSRPIAPAGPKRQTAKEATR